MIPKLGTRVCESFMFFFFAKSINGPLHALRIVFFFFGMFEPREYVVRRRTILGMSRCASNTESAVDTLRQDGSSWRTRHFLCERGWSEVRLANIRQQHVPRSEQSAVGFHEVWGHSFCWIGCLGAQWLMIVQLQVSRRRALVEESRHAFATRPFQVVISVECCDERRREICLTAANKHP